MTNENHARRVPEPGVPAFDFSAPPLIPPVQIARPSSSDSDLDQWASERISIYASLDAAMTRQIVEAISALSALKRQVEEDALAASQKIMVERDRLKQEVEGLRLEQVRLEDMLKESRRLFEGQEARRIALEQSSAAWISQAQAQREEIQLEIRRLKIQLEEARQELQDFYRFRSEEADASGGFAAWMERESKSTPPPPPQKPARFAPSPAPSPDLQLDELIENFDSIPVFTLPVIENEPRIPGELEDFGDAPTPRVAGGSPVIPIHLVRQFTTPTTRPKAGGLLDSLMDDDAEEQASSQAELERIFMGVPLELSDSLPEEMSATPLTAPEVAAPPEAPAPTPEPAPALDVAAPAPEPDPDPEPEKETEAVLPVLSKQGEKTRERIRRARTEQRVQQLLGRRRLHVPEITPAADGGEPEPQETPRPVTVGAELEVSQPTGTARRAKKDTTRLALHQLGEQLGLNAVTPPPTNAFKFAPGFTPPPQPSPMAQLISEVKASASAITPLKNLKPPAPETRPAGPESDPDEADFLDDEFGHLTLEELLEAGEKEIASINENPTPPENPTPFIGDIGTDNAQRFQADPVTPPGLARSDKFELGRLDPPAVPEPSPFPSPMEGPSPRRRSSGSIVFPGFPLPPPPLPTQREGASHNTLATKLTVSNLQGRFSPLVLEKVVRNLEGVFHVIVTDFSKGVLVMDVRHDIKLDLGEKLLSMPELRLKLVEKGLESIEFSQEDGNGGK